MDITELDRKIRRRSESTSRIKTKLVSIDVFEILYRCLIRIALALKQNIIKCVNVIE